MRRLVSIALLAVFTLPGAAPLWATGEKPLPACCRAKGKHHCDGGHEMSTQKAGASGIAFRVAPEKCPMHCCMRSRTASVALPAISRIVSLVAAGESIVHFADTVFVCAGFSSHTDCGPPTLQLS